MASPEIRRVTFERRDKQMVARIEIPVIPPHGIVALADIDIPNAVMLQIAREQIDLVFELVAADGSTSFHLIPIDRQLLATWASDFQRKLDAQRRAAQN